MCFPLQGTNYGSRAVAEHTWADPLQLVPQALHIDAPQHGGLLLRQWSSEDAYALSEAVAMNYEHLRAWEGPMRAAILPEQGRREQIEQWNTDPESVEYGCFERDVIVGGCGIYWERRDTFSLGYWVDTAHGGRGYATAMAEALTSVLAQLAGVGLIRIGHDRTNIASRRIPEKLGYRFDGEVVRARVGASDTGVACWWDMTPTSWHSQPHPPLRTA